MLRHVEVLSAAELCASHKASHNLPRTILRHGRTEGVDTTAEYNAFVTANSHIAAISLHSPVITGGTC